ncbi:MAG: peptidoglycan-binding protein [Dehalococcoidia bacterium]
MALVKAVIRNLDTEKRITCMFNPTDYTFAKSVNWSQSSDKGANVPTLEFAGGEAAVLTLKLFFDTTATGEDVRTKYTNDLWDLAMVNQDKIDPVTQRGKPPSCTFEWGNAWSFEAVVTSINTSFTMFLGDGTPVRATVDLSLKQAKDPGRFPAQNPTSGGIAGHRRHIVEQSETLDAIAAREYGQASHWRHIAEANGIDDPMRVRAGTVLALPPLSSGESE